MPRPTGRSTPAATSGESQSPADQARADQARAADAAQIDRAVLDYIDAIPAEHRPLFDRLHRLIMRACPDATVVLSYKMPTYLAAGRHLYLGVWKHGLSIYGWRQDEDDGFVVRHPSLKTSTGTIRLRKQDAAGISDEEFLGLVRAALHTNTG